MPPTAVIAIIVVLLILIIGVGAWVLLSTPDSPPSGGYVPPSGGQQPPPVPPSGYQPPVVPTPPVQQWQYKAKQDITPGKDLWALSGATVDACKAKCGPDPACKGFTMQRGTCWGKATDEYSTVPTASSAWTKI